MAGDRSVDKTMASICFLCQDGMNGSIHLDVHWAQGSGLGIIEQWQRSPTNATEVPGHREIIEAVAVSATIPPDLFSV